MFGTFGRLQDVGSNSITPRESREIKNIIGFDLTSLKLRDGTDTSENHHAVIRALLDRVDALEKQVEDLEAKGIDDLAALVTKLETRLSNLTLQLYGVTEVAVP